MSNTQCPVHDIVMDTIQDHEGRIRVLEQNMTELSTTLKLTNKILSIIATMIGGAIITYLFKLLTNQGGI